MQWVKSFFAPSREDQIQEVKSLGRRMENQAVRLRKKVEDRRDLMLYHIVRGDTEKGRGHAEALIQFETIARKCEQVKEKVDFFICYARVAPASTVFKAFDLINNTSEKMDENHIRTNFLMTFNSLHLIGEACMPPKDGQWSCVVTNADITFQADKLFKEEQKKYEMQRASE